MSKWAKEWAEAGAICAVFAGSFAFGLALRLRWFLLACAVVLIFALSGCEFGHGR